MPDGSAWRRYNVCTSTNDMARAWILDSSSPALAMAAVSAGLQTAGRGRRGRRWRAAAGDNLLMSIVDYPPYPFAECWRLAFVAAVAINDALRTLGVDAAVKWPNDILVEGAKVSGVLIEVVRPAWTSHGRAQARPGSIADWAAVVGIGVNVNQLRFDEAGTFDTPPTSLRLLRDEEYDVDAVAEVVHERFHHWEARHRTDGFGVIAAAWRDGMAPRAPVRHGGETGSQRDLRDDGAVIVELPNGTLTAWRSVDVR